MPLFGHPRTVSLLVRDAVDLAAEVLARGGRFQLLVNGASMQPWLVAGDRVDLAAVEPARLRVGDIVLTGGSRPLLHRVVRIDRAAGVVVTRGDAADQDDPPLPLGDLVGRVVSVQRPWPVRLQRWMGGGRRRLGRALRVRSPRS